MQIDEDPTQDEIENIEDDNDYEELIARDQDEEQDQLEDDQSEVQYLPEEGEWVENEENNEDEENDYQSQGYEEPIAFSEKAEDAGENLKDGYWEESEEINPEDIEVGNYNDEMDDESWRDIEDPLDKENLYGRQSQPENNIEYQNIEVLEDNVNPVDNENLQYIELDKSNNEEIDDDNDEDENDDLEIRAFENSQKKL